MGPGYWLNTFDNKAYRVDRHENWIMKNLDQLPEKYAKSAAQLDPETDSDEIRFFGVKAGLIRIRKYRNRWSVQLYRAPHKTKDALWSFYEWWIKESGGSYDEVTIHNMYNNDSIDITKKELGQRLKNDAMILREKPEDLANIAGLEIISRLLYPDVSIIAETITDDPYENKEYYRISLVSTTPSGVFSRMRLNNVRLVRETPLTEARQDISERLKGGTIILSTDVNAVLEQNISILDKLRTWASGKVHSIKNRLTRTGKILDVLGQHSVSGVSIGKYFNGYYKADNGTVYSENSFALEMLYLSSEELESIATDLAKIFGQEAVLVKDYNTNDVYFVSSEPIKLDSTDPHA